MAFELKKINLKSINFRNIYEWPIYGRMVVFALVCLAIFYGGYFFDFSDLSNQIYTRYKQEQDLKQQMRSILKAEEEMQQVVLQFPEVLSLLDKWQSQLINAAQLPDLLNQILKLGANNHLQFSLFVPETKKQQGDFYVVPIKVLIRGNYNETANFISQMANLPQVVVIDDFTMLKQTNASSNDTKETEDVNLSGSLTTALTLEVYYLATTK